MLKGTKEDVAKTLKEIASGISEIADSILSENYHPTDWKKIAEKMSLVEACLLTIPEEFAKNRVL